MKIIYRIALAELQSLFYSPVAWLILIVFSVQCTFAFTNVLDSAVVQETMGMQMSSLTMNIYAGMEGFFKVLQNYIYLYIPLLTMGLMSGELSSGSIKLLYSSPVRNSQIILGKYLSMLVYGLVLVAIIAVYVVFSAFVIKDLDVPAVLTGLLGIYLLICAYASIGLFMSSVTSYQVVAAMGTLAIFALLNVMKSVGQSIDLVREITYWLSIDGRCDQFVRGMICSEDVLYFLIVIVLFLTLSIVRLGAIRQKAPWQASLGKYVGIVILAIGIGFLSSRPTLKCFYDATATKQLTLTPNSQNIVSQLKGKLTITSYVNGLDEFNWTGTPANRIYDQSFFEKYLRFKPDTKMKYMYYYHKSNNTRLYEMNPGLSDRQIMAKLCVAQGLDSNMYMPPEEMAKIIDLSSEDYHVVRVLEEEGGKKVFLRMFNDMWYYPMEAEISAAIKQLTDDAPTVVGFLTGHGERDCAKGGDRNYLRLAQERTYRHALINQGFLVESVALTDELPEKIGILVIADMQTSLSDIEMKHLKEYVSRGGNLLIAGDVRRQEVMNPVVDLFGVQFEKGQVVQLHENFTPDFLWAQPLSGMEQLSYHLAGMRGKIVTMPGSVGLDYGQVSGFHVTPLLVSGEKDTWTELETTNFIDEHPILNGEAGEMVQSSCLALALSREIDGCQQKVIILGDADCISNVELKAYRKEIPADNNTFILGIFHWLSNGEYPVDVRRPATPDDDLYIGVNGMKITRYAFYAFSVLLLGLYLFLWYNRRRK